MKLGLPVVDPDSAPEGDVRWASLFVGDCAVPGVRQCWLRIRSVVRVLGNRDAA